MTAQPLEPLLIPPAHPHTIGVQNTADLVGGIFSLGNARNGQDDTFNPHTTSSGASAVFTDFGDPPGNAVTSQ